MDKIRRTIEDTIFEKWTGSDKVVIILGPRQAGKTTLAQMMIKRLDGKVLMLTGDDPSYNNAISKASITDLKNLLQGNDFVFIDEAQKISGIGNAAKMIHDYIGGVHLLLTGSSSFQLNNMAGEALTGRKREQLLFPLSFAELSGSTSVFEEKRNLESRLIFGNYPEVALSQNKREVLEEIADSYLLRDVFALDGVRKNGYFMKLLKALAFQTGSQVSYNELAATVGINKDTVARYLTLLEQSYIVFELPSYSTNQRNELKKSRKIYFYDNGIRNAILRNFALLDARDDREIGLLFENYLVSERIKLNNNAGRKCNSYFWRNTAQAEVDYIEEVDGTLCAWEIKWSDKKKNRVSAAFLNLYPQARNRGVVNRGNYETFLNLPVELPLT